MVAEAAADVEANGPPDEYEPDDDDGGAPGETTQQPAKGKQVVADKKRWGDLEKPAQSKLAMHERFARRQGQQQEQTETAKVRAELEAERARVAQYSQREQQSAQEFRRLYDAGNIDGALKVLGVPGTLGDLQRKLIEAKSGKQLGGRDPRVDEVQQLVNDLKAERAKEKEEFARYQQSRQEEQQAQADMAELSEEIKTLPYEGAEALLELPGFTDLVYDDMRKARGSLQTEAAVRSHRDAFQKLFHTFVEVAQKGGLDWPEGFAPPKSRTVAPRQQEQQRPIAPIPKTKSGGRQYSQRELDNMDPDERWALIKRGEV